MRKALRWKSYGMFCLVLFLSINCVSGEDGILVEKTFSTPGQHSLPSLKRYNYDNLIIRFSGNLACLTPARKYYVEDSIKSVQGFLGAVKCGNISYRIIFRDQEGSIDSVFDLDESFLVTDKAITRKNNLVTFISYDKNGIVSDQFDLDLFKKYDSKFEEVPSLDQLFRQYHVYTYTDREEYSISSVWILSIGIDDYGERKYKNCKSDAVSIVDFFLEQYKKKHPAVTEKHMNSYLLLDSQATKENILSAIQDISRKASSSDYFIFNFSGQSYIFNSDSTESATYLFPYNIIGLPETPKTRDPRHLDSLHDHMISLKLLQEYVQQIAAENQLFISEAGASEKFRVEFLQALMQNSVEVASLLNKNRIVIVPNKLGYDDTRCKDSTYQKGPINYFITSMGSKFNVFNLFDEYRSEMVAYHIKQKEFACQYSTVEYFDIFFERRFLKEYREMLGSTTRGLKGKSKEIKKELNDLTGKRYALLVGTDQYKASDWKDLANPVKDVKAVGDVLRELYGFEVQVLENQPIDSIFSTIGSYYRKVQPNDQVLIYFAGHGDVDEELLSDGFIVCSDSKPPEQDIARNSYISYLKLQKMINNLSARQVLVMLDVCHGGVFDQKAFEKKQRDNPVTSHISNRNVLELLKDKLPLRTRKFLSSVGAESAFDGYAGKHSPFVNQLLQILTSQARDENGIVLLSDIYAVLIKSSLNETATLKISPYMADFGNVDAFTEFILIPAALMKN